MSGTMIVNVPTPRLSADNEQPKPRSVALRHVYTRPSHASDKSGPADAVGLDKFGAREITAAATPNPLPIMMNVIAPPHNATSPAATGGPTTVAMTYPDESIALTRSQRWLGTIRGKRLRRPVDESGAVNDATAAITISSHAGRTLANASSPISVSAHSATR